MLKLNRLLMMRQPTEDGCFFRYFSCTQCAVSLSFKLKLITVSYKVDLVMETKCHHAAADSIAKADVILYADLEKDVGNMYCEQGVSIHSFFGQK